MDYLIHYRIEQAKRLLRETDEPVTNIAFMTGFHSSAYFGKIFKKSIGRTPQEFLMHYRMTKAAELLKLTKLTVSDIGKAVGYDNSFHFSRAFKHVYGIPPREWRNQNQMLPKNGSDSL